jgi:hypothetical protein
MGPLASGGAIGSPGGTHPLVADGDTVHAVWGQGGAIHYRRSDDAGRTWTDAVPLTTHRTAQYLELESSELAVALEVLPRLMQFASHLGDAAWRQVKAFRDPLGGLTGSQRLSDAAFLLWQSIEPLGDVEPGRSRVSGTGLSVFDNHFDPAVVAMVELVEPLDGEPLRAWQYEPDTSLTQSLAPMRRPSRIWRIAN